MIFTSHAFLISLFLLCGLEEMVLSQHGHCAEERCYVLFQEPKDFTSAEKRCKDTEGQLSTVSSKHFDEIFKSVPSGASGSYWLNLHRAMADVQNCSSIAVSEGRNFTVSWEPCGEQLNGFLCQYTLGGEACGGLKAGGGAQVKYTAHIGYEVRDSKRFPPGTIAVVGKVGSKYPDSKHVCFSKNWIQAPWFCEVFDGGCEHKCEKRTCLCPAGQSLLPNKVTCAADPCAKCAHECQREGDTYACKCRKGYRLAADRKSCVDVNECVEENPCTGEGEGCMNTRGGFQCECKDGFEKEDGVCVDISICYKCEHMKCEKISGVYTCQCHKGHRVSKKDPTKCEMYCTERECPAKCILNKDDSKNTTSLDCFCPDGYIRDGADSANSTEMCIDIDECQIGLCDHNCENFYGGFRCGCSEGFKLHNEQTCVPSEEEEETTEKVNESSVGPPYPTAASTHPAGVPSYIKTGSVLGITVFLVMCVMLLLFLLHRAFKRCGKFTFSSIKHQNIDIFYLQQVTTDTYKRLSFDKQFKGDS